MQFLYPGFLWALAALAIPVVIHLFYFRRFKTIYFSNVSFLKEVKEETASRNRLKHLLVLATRLLALLFLVLAFAQPFLPSKQNQSTAGKKYVSVYIDNSFSMNAISNGQGLLDKAKLTAKELAKSYSSDDVFQLLSNDFEGKHQRMVGQEEFLTMLEEVDISPAVRNLDEIAKRQRDMLSRENSANKVAYLLSDFQKNMNVFLPDSTVSYNLIPLAADAQANVYIDTCWFNEPVQLLGQQTSLIVKVRNGGEKTTENNHLVLKLNSETKAMNELTVEAGSYLYDTLRFVIQKAGWNKAELAISDYPITYDDAYFLSFEAKEKIKVVVLSEGKTNSFLAALFSNQTEFDYTQTSAASFNADQLKETQLLIFDHPKSISAEMNSLANSYVAEGGSLLVFPPQGADLTSYNRLLNNFQAPSITEWTEAAQDLAPIDVQQNIFKDVFEKMPDNLNLPKVKTYYKFTQSVASNEELVLRMKDGATFINHLTYKNGSVYMCASPLSREASDLPVHAVFVPMLYKMTLLSMNNGNYSYTIGGKNKVEVPMTWKSGDKVIKIKGSGVELIPEQFAVGNKVLLGLGEQIAKAGFYTAAPDGETNQLQLALNYDRRESDLRFNTLDEIKQSYGYDNLSIVDGSTKEVTSLVRELDRGTALWKWCLALALLFLVIEVFLLRWWKS
jgi:hypothetical protein